MYSRRQKNVYVFIVRYATLRIRARLRGIKEWDSIQIQNHLKMLFQYRYYIQNVYTKTMQENHSINWKWKSRDEVGGVYKNRESTIEIKLGRAVATNEN